MWSTIVTALKGMWIEIVTVTAIAGGTLLVLMKIRDSGRQAERNENMKKTLNAVKAKNAVQRAVSSAGDAERRKLREKWTKGRN